MQDLLFALGDALFNALPAMFLVALAVIGERSDQRRRFKEYEQRRREYTAWRMSHLNNFYRR